MNLVDQTEKISSRAILFPCEEAQDRSFKTLTIYSGPLKGSCLSGFIVFTKFPGFTEVDPETADCGCANGEGMENDISLLLVVRFEYKEKVCTQEIRISREGF